MINTQRLKIYTSHTETQFSFGGVIGNVHRKPSRVERLKEPSMISTNKTRRNARIYEKFLGELNETGATVQVHRCEHSRLPLVD